MILEGDLKPMYLQLMHRYGFELTHPEFPSSYSRDFGHACLTIIVCASDRFGAHPLELFVSSQFNAASDRNSLIGFARGTIDSDRLTSKHLEQFVAFGETLSKIELPPIPDFLSYERD